MDVRPEIIAALGALVKGGVSMDARASAARALGVLRGRAALPDLIDAAHSKNSQLIYESLVAIEKIRDESAGPRIAFLLRDPDVKVQSTAIEAVGVLRDKEALPGLITTLTTRRMRAFAGPRSRPLPCCPTLPIGHSTSSTSRIRTKKCVPPPPKGLRGWEIRPISRS